MRSHEQEVFLNLNHAVENIRGSQSSKARHSYSEDISCFKEKQENKQSYNNKISSELFSDEDVRNSRDNELLSKNKPLQEYICNKNAQNLLSAAWDKFPLSPSEMKINESPKISLLVQRSNKSSAYNQGDSLENLKSNLRMPSTKTNNLFNPFAYSMPDNFADKQSFNSKDLISKKNGYFLIWKHLPID